MPDFKPMLAKEAPSDLGKLDYPLIVQPKLDGIRCTIVGGKALSRTLKEIPNREVFNYLSRPEFEGLDGEIVVGDPSDPNAMQNTTTIVMSKSKPAGDDWHFYVFDHVTHPGLSWKERINIALRQALPTVRPSGRIRGVNATYASGPDEVDKLEAKWLDEGYEGVILRDPSAPYKHGRSGKKGPLLKLKRFIDFEAEITRTR